MVTVCYNHSAYIAETIESILSQEYPNLEYIVIDDGSTDDSWDIIQTYEEKLTYIERLEGYRDTPTIALNYALGKTTGEIMGWLNSDDILLPHSLFAIAHMFADNPDMEWVTGAATTINERSEIISSRLMPKHAYDFLIKNWKIIQQESTFWKRDLWERAGATLDEEQKWAFDTGLWTRFFEHAEHVHSRALLGAFRRAGQSKSVSDEASFLKPSYIHLNAFRKRASTPRMFFAECYRLLRVFRSVLQFVPSRLFLYIPGLRRYGYTVLEFNGSTSIWESKVHNPFRY